MRKIRTRGATRSQSCTIWEHNRFPLIKGYGGMRKSAGIVNKWQFVNKIKKYKLSHFFDLQTI